MKPILVLPHDAPAHTISQGIREIQARCRQGLCGDPDALGRLVRTQLDRAQVMASAACVPLEDLRPTMQAWDDGGIHRAITQYAENDTTVVMVDARAVRITRAKPWGDARNGSLTLSLDAIRGES